jgi:conjugative transposon TraN protein
MYNHFKQNKSMKKVMIQAVGFIVILTAVCFPGFSQKKSKEKKEPVETKAEVATVLPVVEQVSEKPVEPVLEGSISNAVKNEVKAIKLGEENEISAIQVDLAFNKTTSLIFPSAIRSVDLGSKSILADKAVNIENVLNVKAAQIGFNETNFSVITNDGKFYSFVCNYNEFPKSMAYNLTKYESKSNSIGKVDITFNEGNGDKMNDIVENIKRVSKKMNKDILEANMYDINFRIIGLFVKDNTYYVKMQVINRSNINYDIDFIRYFISDQKILKNTSNQELEIVPLNTSEAPDVINGGSKSEIVFAFNKFTIPNNKVVKVMLNEANGGRHLLLNIDYSLILQAKKL